MEAVFVDDNVAYTEELTDREWSTDHVQFIPAGSREIGDLSSREIAKRVAEEVGDDDAVVFINVNLKSEGKSRQDQAGVEVLKFLRLTEHFDERNNEARDTHCVMYSFQSVEQLLREKPSSLILCSDGVTFKRLPSEFSELDLGELVEDKASVDDLDKFLRGEFRLPDERHSWANWWGLKQLYDVHRIVVDRPDLDYPRFVRKQLTELQSVEGVSIYAHRKKDLTNNVEKYIYKIENIRDSLSKKSINIFQIDDLWDKGWYNIISRMIYANENYESSLYPSDVLTDESYDEDEREDIIKRLFEQIEDIFETKYAPNLILIDMRLFGEKGVSYEVEEISGNKLLKKIRSKYRGVPVIVTTASNKAWSRETLVQAGADGYWIKEGIDDRRSPEETVRNYLSLLELIETATGEKYQFTRRYGKAIEDLKSEDEFWWEGKEWENKELGRKVNNDISKEEVFEMLEDSITMTRMYLRGYEMESRDNIDTHRAPEDMIIWSIAQHLGKIIEKVHSFSKLKGSFSNYRTIGGINKSGYWKECRGDWFGMRLYEFRSMASHIDKAPKVDWTTVKHFMSNMICYLQFGPKESFGPKEGSLPKIREMRRTYPNTYNIKFENIFSNR